jgi:2,3-bisphosphoglycerate-independent phosphoglycerate mutase
MDTARLGKTVKDTIPEGMSTGSDVAALTILGYDTSFIHRSLASQPQHGIH